MSRLMRTVLVIILLVFFAAVWLNSTVGLVPIITIGMFSLVLVWLMRRDDNDKR